MAYQVCHGEFVEDMPLQVPIHVNQDSIQYNREQQLTMLRYDTVSLVFLKLLQ